MTPIVFQVFGTPVGKQRPRVGRHGAYTPAKTRAWESQVGWAARIAMRDLEPLTGDLSVLVDIHRKDRRRVDLDNCLKAVLDGMNGIVMRDDSQVVEIHARLHRGAAWNGVDVQVNECEGESDGT